MLDDILRCSLKRKLSCGRRAGSQTLRLDCCLDAPGQTWSRPEYAPTDPRRTASPRRAPRGMEWERYGAENWQNGSCEPSLSAKRPRSSLSDDSRSDRSDSEVKRLRTQALQDSIQQWQDAAAPPAPSAEPARPAAPPARPPCADDDPVDYAYEAMNSFLRSLHLESRSRARAP